MKKRRFLLFFFLGLSTNIWAKEYFISLSGNDSNAGTIHYPLLTIFKASEKSLPGDTITIRAGIYFLDKPFKPVCSGYYNKWIIYRSFYNEKAIFDGSKILSEVIKNKEVKFSKLTQGIFQIEKVNFLKFQGIEVRNSNAAGFIVRGPACSNISLINCFSNNSHNSGIGLWYCDSVKVTGCEVTGANNNSDVYYEVGEHKEIEAPHEAISICGAKYFDVSYNIVYDCYKEGIDCKEISKHGKIHHNTVYNLPRQAYYVDAWFGLLEDVELYENKASSCMWGFAISVEGKKSKVKNIRFHHNLIYNITAAGVLFGLWGANGERSDIHIYNNTFYQCGSPNIYSGGVGSFAFLSKNFKDVFIYRNICDKGWDYEMGFTFRRENIEQELKVRNFVAHENLFESVKSRPSREGQFHVQVIEYLPKGNQIGAPLYKNEIEKDFIPEFVPAIKPANIIWKYPPSPWFGTLKPLKSTS